MEEEKITSRNSNFANINKGKNVWWINPDQGRFTEDYYLLLNDGDILILLFIPENFFSDLKENFRIRKDNDRVDLEISSDKNHAYLHDVKSGGSGVSFSDFLLHKIKIPEEYKLPAKTKHVEKEPYSKIASRNSAPPKSINRTQQRIIKSGQSNVSYYDLFSAYLEGAVHITIQDPYIRYPHQFKNLLEFCMMLRSGKDSEETLNLELVTWNEKDFHNQSKRYFEEVVSSVKDLNIRLSYKFENNHDRYIQTDTGWKIILGRGLDIFEKPEQRFSIADLDQKRRKCKPCEITYLRE